MSIRVLRGQTPSQQAAAVADANYEQLKELVINTVQGKLAAGKIRLPRVDLEAAYNYGWHGVCQHIAQGEPVITLTGFVIDVTYKRALDIYRQRQEGQHADADLDSHAVEVDLAEQIDDQQKIQRLFERLKDRLNAKERNAVMLCVLHGFKRTEAAERLGIPEPVNRSGNVGGLIA